jgi:multiple sugar transport system ATP-binding protein
MGTIQFGGRRVNELPPKDRDIAMVFENYALYPHKTVFENMANSLRLRRVAAHEIKERVTRAAELLQIEKLLDRRPFELSGGQKQRVAIGRAIVRKPQVFLFDEPIAHLDAKLRTHMRGEIKRLQRELGITTIYVTHDQLEALSMADRIAILHEGVLQQFGTPSDVYNDPANAWVASFVGEPPMNFLDCKLSAGPDGPMLLHSSINLNLPASRLSPSCVSGQTVQAGIRPENLRVTMEDPGGSEWFRGTIFAVEPIGGDTLVAVTLGDTRVLAKVPAGFVANMDEACWVAVDRTKIHLFDAADGKAIPRPTRQ